MKKLILFITAAFMAITASATKWAVVGAYSNPEWNFEASTVLEGTGNDLSCTISNLTNSFKIVDIDVTDWSVQYGTATLIEINTPYTLQAKNGGPDPANITFAGIIQAVKNATVKWNPSTATMEIIANESDLVKEYPTLYVTGGFCNWDKPGEGSSVLCTQSDGIYTATVNLGDSGNVEFKLAGNNWSNEIAGGVEVTADDAIEVTRGGDNLKTSLKGTQTLTFNYNTMMMTFGDPSLTEKTPVRVWAVVGNYTNPIWNFEASTILTGEGDNLSCEIPSFVSGFKIVDIANNNWNTQYGLPSGSTVYVNTPYTLEYNSSDIEFVSFLSSVSNAVVEWNPSTYEFKITAAGNDIDISEYPTLYVTGSFCDWASPGNSGSVVCERNGAVYSAVVDLGNDSPTTFLLAGVPNSDGSWPNKVSGGVAISNNAGTGVRFDGNGADLTTTLTGSHTLYFNIETMSMAFDYSDFTTGVTSVEENIDAPAVYYNLQGVKVANPDKGIYIVKRGNKTSKVIL